LSKGKEFSILVKIDRNFPNVETNMNVIAMEIHEVPKKKLQQIKPRLKPRLKNKEVRG